jgi:hypothetical protein
LDKKASERGKKGGGTGVAGGVRVGSRRRAKEMEALSDESNSQMNYK